MRERLPFFGLVVMVTLGSWLAFGRVAAGVALLACAGIMAWSLIAPAFEAKREG